MLKRVHVELVPSLSTETFRVVPRRFIARRGKAKNIYSDNCTKFQGPANEPYAIYKMTQSTSQMATIQKLFATDGCDCKFIPPHRSILNKHKSAQNELECIDETD